MERDTCIRGNGELHATGKPYLLLFPQAKGRSKSSDGGAFCSYKNSLLINR